MKQRLLILAVVILISGCGLKETVTDLVSGDDDTVDPPAPLVEFKPRVNVLELWSKDTGIGTDEQYLKLAPVVANQHLFIVDAEGRLLAMDATNGNKLWSQTLDTRSDTDEGSFWYSKAHAIISGGPGFGENTVLVGTSEGDVIAYSSESGNEMWRSKVSSEILSSPQKAEDTVVVRTNDGKIFGIDGDKGKRLWIYDRTVPALTLRGTSSPTIENGVVIAGFDGGKLAALELRTGKLLWETRIATARGRSELDRMVDIDSEPIIVEGVIYVATFQGNLAAVQMDSGRLLWTRDTSTHAGFTADKNNIYVTDDSSHIWAFDRFTGTNLWTTEKLHAREATAPASIGDYIVVGDYEGYLHWLDKVTGNFVARNKLSDERIIAQPVVVGKILYAYCSNGKLAAYTYR